MSKHDPIDWDELDAETQHELVSLAAKLGEESEQSGGRTASRREFLGAITAAGLGGSLLSQGADRAFEDFVNPASAGTQSVAQFGEAGEPFDFVAEDIYGPGGQGSGDAVNFESVDADDLSNIQVAKRDGALDINQAITDSSLPYGGVLIPPGTHDFSDTVTIQNSDLGIIGWGHGGSDIQFSGSDLFVVGDDSNYARDVLFQNLRLEGTDSAGERGYVIQNAYDTHIRNVYLRDFDVGFRADNSGPNRNIDIHLDHFVSESNIGNGMVFDATPTGNRMERIQVTNGYSFGNDGHGVLLKDGSLGRMFWQQFVAASNGKAGLRVEGASFNTFTQCRFQNNNSASGGNFDVELSEDAGGAGANTNRFVNCSLGSVKIDNASDSNYFLGGTVDSIQFGDSGGNDFIRSNTHILGVQGFRNVASGTITDAENGDLINYSLDDEADHIELTVKNNNTGTGISATVSAGIGNGESQIVLKKSDGTDVTSTDAVNLDWRVVGDTFPTGNVV